MVEMVWHRILLCQLAVAEGLGPQARMPQVTLQVPEAQVLLIRLLEPRSRAAVAAVEGLRVDQEAPVAPAVEETALAVLEHQLPERSTLAAVAVGHRTALLVGPAVRAWSF
jgi:hypothetical protein